MALRLPTAEELGISSVATGRGLASADVTPVSRGALALAKGVQDVGGGLIDIAERRTKQDDALGKAKADASFIKAHTDLLTEQADNPDPTAYAQKSRALLQQAGANIGDDRQRELWMLGHEASLAHGTSVVHGHAQRAVGDAEIAGIRQAEDDAQEVIRKSQDPIAREAMVNAIRTRWNKAAEQGYVTDVQAQAYKKAFATRGIDTRLEMLTPEEQVAALQGPPGSRDDVVSRIIGVESGGDPRARNPLSTATGAGQFTEGTWIATVQAHRPDLARGRSRDQVLALRNDGALSREMTGHLLDDNLAALKAQGLPTTPTAGYLAHFLGSSGAAAVLKAAPGTPVSDVLGEDQIAANRSVLAGKTVDNVVGWAGRKMGQSPDAGLAAVLPADQREIRILRAQSEIDTRARQAQRAYHEESAALQARMSDDLASIEATGQPNPLVKAEDVERVLGPQASRDWLAQRARSRLVHEALDGIGSLPEGEIEQRLRGLEPRPGVDGFTEDMTAYSKARKRADALMQARRADPALAVESLPSVREARTAAQYDTTPKGGRAIQPQSAQAIVRSRLAAQNQLGIPEPMAVTKSEATVIARQLRAIGDDDAAGLRRFVGSLQATYGEYADEVLASTIQHQNVNRDLAVAATDTLGKLSRGQLPSEQDRSRLQRANAGQRMDDALNGRMAPDGPSAGQPAAPGASGLPPQRAAPLPLNFDPTFGATGDDYSNPARAEPRVPEPGEFQGAPTGAGLVELYRRRDDPAARAEFDATFGRGTAERAIAELDRRGMGERR